MILMRLKERKILNIDSNILAVSFKNKNKTFKNKNKTKYFSTIETIFGEMICAPGYKSLTFPHVALTNV